MVTYSVQIHHDINILEIVVASGLLTYEKDLRDDLYNSLRFILNKKKEII